MTDWRTIRSESRLLTSVRTVTARVGTAVDGSWMLRRLRASERLVSRATATSHVGAAGRTLGRWVRRSWLYRWLTKEPDPDVIVIDLRETWTVGPVIAGIDWLASKTQQAVQWTGLGRLGRGVEQAFRAAPVQVLGIIAFFAVLVNTAATSQLRGLTEAGLGLRLIFLAVATLMTRVEASWDELRDGRFGSLVRAIFEPPELPEEETANPPKISEEESPTTEEGTANPPEPSEDETPKIEEVAKLEDTDDR